MDPFSIPIEPIRPPHYEVDPSLRTVVRGVPDEAAIDAPVPEVVATAEERFRGSDKDAITHVVIQVTISRQLQIFRCLGYKYDWDRPFPFWHFLGRMVAKGVFDDKSDLKELNFVAIGRREFVAYTTSTWRAAAAAQKTAGVAGLELLPPLKVIEVNLKKPQPGQPMEMTWAPARALFTAQIREWNERAGNPVDHNSPKEAEKGDGGGASPGQ